MNKTKNEVNIDLTELDLEIERIKAQIDELTKAYNDKMSIKSGLMMLKDKGVDAFIASIKLMNSSTTNESESQYGRVGEFIINYLKLHGTVDSKDIIKAFALRVHKTPEDVRNNVSNALSRAKSAGLVNNKENPGGRRAGSKWFLTKSQKN